MNHFFLFAIALFCCVSATRAQSVIQMQKQSGVYTVPCKVNGVPMRFIFDTGASQVSISLTEAEFLAKNGLLVESDFIGTEYYQNANGAVYEGMKVMLREIEFGDIILKNVVASIAMNNDAPLLLGQSILARIGSYQIDPVKHTVTVTRPMSNSATNSVIDIEGNSYQTVNISGQIWMAENLRTTKFSNGEPIAFMRNDVDWVSALTGSYSYYNNDPSLIPGYGLLYNWEAVIDGRGICPTGWHIPTKEEVDQMLANVKSAGFRTGSLKGSTGWNLPNLEAINYLDFNAIPGGKRWFRNGQFQFLNEGGYYWTSSASGPERAVYFAFAFDSPELRIGSFFRNDGFSCRCIKD